MSPSEIAILALLAGLFLAVLVAGLAVVIWSALSVKRSAESLATHLHGFQAENAKIAESAKSNFQAIRQEMRGALETYSAETKATFESHQKAMQGMIESINGAQLQVSAQRIGAAANRMTQIAVTLQDLLIEKQEVDETGTADESYAPPGASIYGQSTASAMDEEAQVEEARGL